jgi:hypothetical protein
MAHSCRTYQLSWTLKMLIAVLTRSAVRAILYGRGADAMGDPVGQLSQCSLGGV